MRSRVILFAGFATLLLATHLPYLRLPFHWDELGQFIPAALDLFRTGAWVPHSTAPNIHPPGLEAVLAAVWSVTGFSIFSARATMLAIACIGVYLSFLLAVRLARGATGLPAFAAVAFLMAAPMFYTQSMMVLLDMPAMVLTTGALLLFLDERYAASAVICTALVLTKETALTTPMVFGAWLVFRDRRVNQALYFTAPAVALAAWLLVLHNATGSWFGNADFGQYNVTQSLTVGHIAYAILRRCYTLFIADGHWIGALALYFGRRMFKTPDWRIAIAVACAQLVPIVLLGGAVLDRYVLPILPILYAAFAVALSTYRRNIRVVSGLALLALLIAGWFIDPPFPLPLENNLAVVDFVHLQQDAAQYLEAYAHGQTVATTWPLAEALREPDFGYVQQQIPVQAANGAHLADFQALNLAQCNALVLFSHEQQPPVWLPAHGSIYKMLGLKADEHPDATAEELAGIGFTSRARFTQGRQWVEIYARAGTW